MGHEKSFLKGKVCDKCGYRNQEKNWKLYGTCTRCGAVLDEKIKFKYEMYTKLKLWRKK